MTDDSTALVPAQRTDLAHAIGDHLRQYAHDARGAYAGSTEASILKRTRAFATWCAAKGLAPLPATTETIVAFIDEFSTDHAPAYVRAIISAVSHTHTAAGLTDPTKGQNRDKAREVWRRGPVAFALRRMNRTKGTRQKQAHGITYDIRNLMLKHSGDRLIDKRDKALLAVAYEGLFRRSELLSLLIDDWRIDTDGTSSVLLRKSKTDQEGAGAVQSLPHDATAMVQDWVQAAGLTAGPIFRAVEPGGKKVGGALSEDSNPGRAVLRIFRKMALRAGLDPEVAAKISGHSARVGMAQDMTAAGFSIAEIMQAGRWQSETMPARYGERLHAKRGANMKLAAIQGRV